MLKVGQRNVRNTLKVSVQVSMKNPETIGTSKYQVH